MEKISASIGEYDDLAKQKNAKNYKSLQMFNGLVHICSLISSDPLSEILEFKTEKIEGRL